MRRPWPLRLMLVAHGETDEDVTAPRVVIRGSTEFAELARAAHAGERGQAVRGENAQAARRAPSP